MQIDENLKDLLIKLKQYRDEYKDLKHQYRDEKCELIYKGKYEAYKYVCIELQNILKWHDIL